MIVSILYLLSPLVSPKPFPLEGSHVLVTGGSSGIGKAVAIEVVKRGANVTLVARNQLKLSDAKDEVEKYLKDSDKQKVVCVSVDLSKDYSAVERAVRQASEMQGPVGMLVNCAGYAICGRFEELSIEDFKVQTEGGRERRGRLDKVGREEPDNFCPTYT